MPYTLTSQQLFDSPEISILIFHNVYPEGKQGGLEIIQHGLRVATNGDLRLEPAPGQWAPLPKVQARAVNGEQVSVRLAFEQPDLSYTVRVWAAGEQVEVAVDLDRPLPPELAGRVGFNLEMLPQAFSGQSYFMDDRFGVFPMQANGPAGRSAYGMLLPTPLASGRRLVAAPGDALRRLEILSNVELLLLDARVSSHNGWFVVRGLLPEGVTQDALRWTLIPTRALGWRRPPAILHSQVGYHPDQVKVALVELDAADNLPAGDCILTCLRPDGEPEIVMRAQPEDLGCFLRARYARLDFTQVRRPGLYRLHYGSVSTLPFQISPTVYQWDVWQPTLETFLPVQMCHVRVEDGMRVWHGACHQDDALQAPPDHAHFDGYHQYPELETPYAAYAHIPGLDQGGWHDAGDYDLAAGSQASTTYYLALACETFHVSSDQTSYDPAARLVRLHVPDGRPDIVKQIAHGAQALLAGYRASGHCFPGIIENQIRQYVHLGDAATMTDNQVQDGPGSDDRWAFTNRCTALEYQAAAALAAASRVLGGHFDALADECLKTARQVWDFEHSAEPATRPVVYVWNNPAAAEVLAAVELLIADKERPTQYTARLAELLPVISEHFGSLGWAATRALPYVNDEALSSTLRQSALAYRDTLVEEMSASPFGLPFGPGWLRAARPNHDPFDPDYHSPIWGVGWNLQSFAAHYYYLVKAYPADFEREPLLRVLNYVLGWHPAGSLSLVSGVGAQSLTVAYGTNRAENSYIPGGIASGPALLRPDFTELIDPFPWLWQQKEYVIGGAATYVFLVLAAEDLLNGASSPR